MEKELSEEEKQSYITFFNILKENANKEDYISWGSNGDVTNHVLKYLKESNRNWNDIILIGHILVQIALESSIDRLYNSDLNTNILKSSMIGQKEKNWNESIINRDLMLLTSAYNGKPLNNIKVDISNSELISNNLKERFQLLRKYGFKCVYCGRSPPEVKLQLEHVNPRKYGGRTTDSNLVPACFECNSGKREHLLEPEESSLIKLRFFDDN